MSLHPMNVASTRHTDPDHWFTQPGPTESFRRTAPRDLLEDNYEVAPPQPNPNVFTTVGPTPQFLGIR